MKVQITNKNILAYKKIVADIASRNENTYLHCYYNADKHHQKKCCVKITRNQITLYCSPFWHTNDRVFNSKIDLCYLNDILRKSISKIREGEIMTFIY